MRRGHYSDFDDGVKLAAFEHALECGDPTAFPAILEMAPHRRTLHVNAWWKLAIVREPHLKKLLTPDFYSLQDATETLSRSRPLIDESYQRLSKSKNTGGYRRVNSETDLKTWMHPTGLQSVRWRRDRRYSDGTIVGGGLCFGVPPAGYVPRWDPRFNPERAERYQIYFSKDALEQTLKRDYDSAINDWDDCDVDENDKLMMRADVLQYRVRVLGAPYDATSSETLEALAVERALEDRHREWTADCAARGTRFANSIRRPTLQERVNKILQARVDKTTEERVVEHRTTRKLKCGSHFERWAHVSDDAVERASLHAAADQMRARRALARRREKDPRKTPSEITCCGCGETVYNAHAGQKWCSQRCRNVFKPKSRHPCGMKEEQI